MNNIIVSVIMPAYNCSKTIGESIDSVINQTFTDWELIIVNDASVDNTKDIIEKYLNKDSRISLYSLEKNSGSAAAKNYGLKFSIGRYVAFLDSDDIWFEKKLEIQIDFMQKNGACFSFTGYEFFNDSSMKKRKYITVPKSINYRKYLSNTIIGNSTVVLDKKIIGNVIIQNGYLEDVLTWMYYLKKGFIANGINQVLMSYRVYSQSKSGKKIKNSKRYFKCLRETQNLSFFVSVYYWIFYVINASKKRLFAKKRTIS